MNEPALRREDTNPVTTGEQSCLFSESPHVGRSVGDLHHTLEFDLGSVPSLRQKKLWVIESLTERYGERNNLRCQ